MDIRVRYSYAQIAFAAPFAAMYLLSPAACHSFAAHLNSLTSEAITDALRDLDSEQMPRWAALAAPDAAVRYWGLQVRGIPFPSQLPVVILYVCVSHRGEWLLVLQGKKQECIVRC